MVGCCSSARRAEEGLEPVGRRGLEGGVDHGLDVRDDVLVRVVIGLDGPLELLLDVVEELAELVVLGLELVALGLGVAQLGLELVALGLGVGVGVADEPKRLEIATSGDQHNDVVEPVLVVRVARVEQGLHTVLDVHHDVVESVVVPLGS